MKGLLCVVWLWSGQAAGIWPLRVFCFGFGVGGPVCVFVWLGCGPVVCLLLLLFLASRLWGERAQFGLDGRFGVVLFWVGQVLLHY